MDKKVRKEIYGNVGSLCILLKQWQKRQLYVAMDT